MKRIILFLTILSIIIIIWSMNTISIETETNEARSTEVKKMVEREHKSVVKVGVKHPIGSIIDEYIKEEPLLEGSLAGISIRSSDTGELYYEHFGNTRFRPASNMKLLTGVAALSVLGQDYTFSTEILTDGNVVNNQLKGDLFIQGKGDPTLLREDFTNFARKIKQSGIERIDGNIIADDSWYDDVRLSRDITWDDEHWYYAAQISALTASPNDDYDAGSIIVTVTPQEVGKKPTVTVSPNTDYVQVINTARTVSKNQEEDLTFNRKHGTNIITIEGDIPVGSPGVKEWMAVWEPTKYALSLFTQALEEEGVSWTKNTKVGITSNEAKLLLKHDSMPLSELMVPYMKLSNNGHAEVFIKELGRNVHGKGSWEEGIEVLENVISEYGIDTDKFVIRDGSGLSHINMLVPNELSKLLYEIQDETWFSVYEKSLPVAGIPDRLIGGTLRYRMAGQSVQAKTGTISGVVTLSGYIDTNSGERLIFSIMLNNLLDEVDGIGVIDHILEIVEKNG
ncbi:D-alanyl-D-alanine carboxypeptidase/D-alanyl-D-alanine endopeptidase [Ornithinibacillus halophilus]|uniref:D-alanyl-D-alanine carboxypeptidase / D-alanyl-D-alanine-endopeptidase (Penicillin-binding protein 4) n=1 Tax=Ornithinibacillus halophilus TaxID=930117 RepID=A0A1M5FJA6_9BACI|nr:D-alanyl-D-alanine carboxypeptidase/D-alanyl-D-alanine-endopeptidase [Ornithinibacillus halophilus]SHF91603.1 D-alanyl-D-alanine carboxypeptidase / D-alanyl-D-alanine-endopeptidase (penicillin-binding protein 4) [Ornithinibacillus halophilus]